ncbi:unnamed protein product [Oikopleura dioica]|uniref:Uncharacterized protein n=1 Tax=Oikopleura dioica TaxID=34765 RepID=E4YR28_OIKDI|nr:unnamed protein product [Oikopleura dioica]
MNGIVPVKSPQPTQRSGMSRLELTVPEPSLIAEFSTENLQTFHALPSLNSNETTPVARLCSTQNNRSSKSKNSLRVSFEKNETLTPILKNSNNSNCQRKDNSFQDNYFPVPHSPSPTPPSPQTNGTMELIETIRSQELEIHKHKKANEKQLRQLEQQAQIIQQLKSEIEEHESEKKQKPSTAEKSSNTEKTSIKEFSSQTEPLPSKETKESSVQTSESIVFKQPQHITPKIEYYEPSRDMSLAASVSLNYSNAHSKQSTNYTTDTDSDSDAELPPEALAELVGKLNQTIATCNQEPKPQELQQDSHKQNTTAPAAIHHIPNDHFTSSSASEDEEYPGDTMFIRNIAPSYGTRKDGKLHHVSMYGEESVCAQLARKYGVPNPSAAPSSRNHSRRYMSTPDQTFNTHNSSDMSLATARIGFSIVTIINNE